ncbi:MAG: linear amide C-N hydrolase [Dehalococcoidales bacterium]|nr:MAG: linear amide C-N hydrolase [Dehalococcoidales bacterium]
MKTAIFQGNHYDIGQQAVAAFRNNPVLSSGYTFDEKLYKAQLDIYREYYPEILEELKGMVEGGGFEEKKLVFLFTCSEIIFFTEMLKIPPGCTIYGIRNRNGAFVGRNYDWSPEAENQVAWLTWLNPEKNLYTGFTDLGAGSNTAEDTINDKGLYIGLTFASNHRWSYGISNIHICRLVAETCATVDEALAVFERVPLCCPKNYFIADRYGDMAVVEHTSERFKILYPKDGVLIQTNHYVDPELAEEDMALQDMPLTDTYLRYYETLLKLNLQKDTLRYSNVIKLLTDPGSYVFHDNPAVRTLWSLALDMINSRHRVYWNLTGRRRTRLLEI